jgi:hypothetical protein
LNPYRYPSWARLNAGSPLAWCIRLCTSTGTGKRRSPPRRLKSRWPQFYPVSANTRSGPYQDHMGASSPRMHQSNTARRTQNKAVLHLWQEAGQDAAQCRLRASQCVTRASVSGDPALQATVPGSSTRLLAQCRGWGTAGPHSPRPPHCHYGHRRCTWPSTPAGTRMLLLHCGQHGQSLQRRHCRSCPSSPCGSCSNPTCPGRPRGQSTPVVRENKRSNCRRRSLVRVGRSL